MQPVFFLFLVPLSGVLVLFSIWLLNEIIQAVQRSRRKTSKGQSTGQRAKVPADLVRMLQGDRVAAQRLIDYTRQANPGRSHQWVCDKVIHDLERDRY